MPSTWADILKAAGWPTTMLVVDFETYFDKDYTLSKMSIPEYINDPRFEFTGVGWAEIKPGQEWQPRFVGAPLVMDRIGAYLLAKYGKNLEDITVVIQNVHFDAYILKHKFGIVPPYVVDVKMLSHNREARASARLKDIAKRLGLPSKGDTMQFIGLRWADMTLEQKQALNTYCCGDVTDEGMAAEKMLPLISNPHIELPLMRHTLKLWLESPLRFNFDLARTLMGDMGTLLNEKVKAVGGDLKLLGSPIQLAEAILAAMPEGERTLPLKRGKPTPRMVTLTGMPGMIPTFAKNDEGLQALAEHPVQAVRDLVEARLAVKSWPGHIKRIGSMYRMAEANGGTLPIPLTYYGGHTGRWSGSEKINVQNLGSKSHKLINKIRELITAPPGYSLLVVDYAQIEARYLAWAAGQRDLIEAFGRAEDVYSLFATKIFQARVRKPHKDDIAALAALLFIRRAFGKEGILGCGYGMGGAKFFGRMKENSALREKIEAGEYDAMMATRVVQTYRKTYPAIPKYWGEVETNFKYAMRNPGVERCTTEDGLTFTGSGSSVYMKLPSGRTMRYPNCRLIQGAKGEEIHWKYGHLWGGSITENMDQAACRDILAEAILRCEGQGCPIIYHCHDELMSISPDYRAKKDLEWMMSLMRVVPDWCKGMPLDYEGQIMKVYGK